MKSLPISKSLQSSITESASMEPLPHERESVCFRTDVCPARTQGVIDAWGDLHELRKFANKSFGDQAWSTLLTSAGLEGSAYLASRSYPDEQVTALVGAASRISGTPPGQLLEAFGEFIAPDLLEMFRSLIRSDWRTLDVLENTEEAIHKVVRLQYADAAPPYLHATRTAADAVTIVYTSPRRLCAIAKGIARGVAAHYDEAIELQEPSCMLLGARQCEIVVRLASGATV